MAWKEIKGEGAEVWDFEKNPDFEGVFVRREDNVGPNNSKMYHFDSKGEEVALWGNTLLDTRLVDLKEGQQVQIKYLGKAKSPKTGREYKNFQVLAWEEDLPF